MNYDKKNTSRKQAFAIMVVVVLIVGAIVYMKSASDRTGNPNSNPKADTSSAIAIPDIDSVNTDLPAVEETITVAMPDTIGHDKRPPYEAGYEDGYFSGMDDGAENKPKASYDETNAFPSREAKGKYVQGYREGYAKGFDDGKNGTQFNMPSKASNVE